MEPMSAYDALVQLGVKGLDRVVSVIGLLSPSGYRRGGHRPLKFGFRFSLYARTPSSRSSVGTSRL